MYIHIYTTQTYFKRSIRSFEFCSVSVRIFKCKFGTFALSPLDQLDARLLKSFFSPGPQVCLVPIAREGCSSVSYFFH